VTLFSTFCVGHNNNNKQQRPSEAEIGKSPTLALNEIQGRV
jgi:hypothetical protein